MNITFRQLRVFAEVARHGSMARAAEALHLTPPAVSMQVKEVEAQVGLPLFDRHGRAVTLSMAGEYFLVHARRLLAALKEADDAMKRLKRVERGQLTIGLVTAAKYFVPHLLSRFRDEHAGVEVRLQVAANRERLVALLQTGEVDLCVMGRPPRELGTRAEGFARHEMAFVAAPSHPLVNMPQAPAERLAAYDFLVREAGSGTRATLERFFAEHHIAPHVAMELTSNETIKQAVIAGLGLSLMSLPSVELELRAGLIQVLDIAGTPIVRTWNVVHLGSRVLSPAAEGFRYFLLEQGDTYLRERSEGLRTALAAPAPD